MVQSIVDNQARIKQEEIRRYPVNADGVHPFGWSAFQSGYWKAAAEEYWQEIVTLRAEVARLIKTGGQVQ